MQFHYKVDKSEMVSECNKVETDASSAEHRTEKRGALRGAILLLNGRGTARAWDIEKYIDKGPSYDFWHQKEIGQRTKC